jgi:hypothetical protein
MNQESSMSLCFPNIILSTVDGVNQSCGVLVYSGTPVESGVLVNLKA